MNVTWNYLIIIICFLAIINSIYRLINSFYLKKSMTENEYVYKYYFLVLILAIFIVSSRFKFL